MEISGSSRANKRKGPIVNSAPPKLIAIDDESEHEDDPDDCGCQCPPACPNCGGGRDSDDPGSDAEPSSSETHSESDDESDKEPIPPCRDCGDQEPRKLLLLCDECARPYENMSMETSATSIEEDNMMAVIQVGDSGKVYACSEDEGMTFTQTYTCNICKRDRMDACLFGVYGGRGDARGKRQGEVYLCRGCQVLRHTTRFNRAPLWFRQAWVREGLARKQLVPICK